jgi:hypothetical protein
LLLLDDNNASKDAAHFYVIGTLPILFAFFFEAFILLVCLNTAVGYSSKLQHGVTAVGYSSWLQQ